MNISSKKLTPLLLCMLILSMTSNSSAMNDMNFKPTNLIIGTCIYSIAASVLYTLFKTPQETIPVRKNAVLNFLDNSWCGNLYQENGTITEGNVTKPNPIKARGVIGKSLHYTSKAFLPACALVALGLLDSIHRRLDYIQMYMPHAYQLDALR